MAHAIEFPLRCIKFWILMRLHETSACVSQKFHKSQLFNKSSLKFQSSSLYGAGYERGSSCGNDSFLNPHSAFESSSDKLLGNLTPTRGLTTHQNHLSSPRVFSSMSSTDGLSPTSRYYVLSVSKLLHNI